MSAKSNKIGVVQLTILTMVMMGSGIIMLPTKLAEIGTISIVSWLVTAVGSTALAYAFAQCGMFSRKSGGMGGYAEYSFGKAGNFMANYTYGVSLVIANTAIAISAVGYGSEFLGNPSPLSIAHGRSSLFGLRLFLTSVAQELRVTSVHSPFGV